MVSIPLVLVVSLGVVRSDLLFGRKSTTALFAGCNLRPGGKKALLEHGRKRKADSIPVSGFLFCLGFRVGGLVM